MSWGLTRTIWTMSYGAPVHFSDYAEDTGDINPDKCLAVLENNFCHSIAHQFYSQLLFDHARSVTFDLSRKTFLSAVTFCRLVIKQSKSYFIQPDKTQKADGQNNKIGIPGTFIILQYKFTKKFQRDIILF